MRSREKGLSSWMMRTMISICERCFTMRRGLSIKAFFQLETELSNIRPRTFVETSFLLFLRVNPLLQRL